MSRLWTDNGRTTECEDRARILETEFALQSLQPDMVNHKESFEHKTSFSRRNDSRPSLKQVNDPMKHPFM